MERWVALGSFRVYDSRAPRKLPLELSPEQQKLEDLLRNNASNNVKHKLLKLETTQIKSLYVQYVQYQLDHSTCCREKLQQAFIYADLVADFCEQLVERAFKDANE